MFFQQLILALCIVSISSLETCQLKDGRNGTCIDIEQCPFAIGQLHNNIPPKICSFNGLRPIVCCIDEYFFQNIHGEGINAFCASGYPRIVHYNQYTDNYWRSRHTDLAVGGVNSLPKEFPHMAALGYLLNNETIWACGGTLITKRHVLTAAHCLQSNYLGNVTYVRLGALNLRSEVDDASPQNFLIANKIRHPDYRPPAKYNDIAIIELDREAEINNYVSTACLNTDREFNRTIFLAIGWGKVGFFGELADHLQKVTLQLVSDDKCAKSYEKIMKIRLPEGIQNDLQICAGAPTADTCPGDSGGPLEVNTYRGGVVYGITSFGVACGISRKPGVYTRVSHYIDWIKSTILSEVSY